MRQQAFFASVLLLFAAPALAQDAAEKPKEQVAETKPSRRTTNMDPTLQELAGEIDSIRAKMAAENQRHFETITTLRDELKAASDKMVAYRKPQSAEQSAKAQ